MTSANDDLSIIQVYSIKVNGYHHIQSKNSPVITKTRENSIHMLLDVELKKNGDTKPNVFIKAKIKGE